jgi:cytochrome c-type biogenesis protein CcmE
MLTRTVVTLAALSIGAALVVQGSFRRAAPFETPSALRANHGLLGARVRLVGVVRAGSVKPFANGVRFAVRDEKGVGYMVVQYAGDTSDELRPGRLVEVTGAFRGHAFEAQPSTLVAICSRTHPEQHC